MKKLIVLLAVLPCAAQIPGAGFEVGTKFNMPDSEIKADSSWGFALQYYFPGTRESELSIVTEYYWTRTNSDLDGGASLGIARYMFGVEMTPRSWTTFSPYYSLKVGFTFFTSADPSADDTAFSSAAEVGLLYLTDRSFGFKLGVYGLGAQTDIFVSGARWLFDVGIFFGISLRW